MGFFIWLLIGAGVFVFLIWLVYKREWRKLKVASVNIPFHVYMLEYFEMFLTGISQNEIFRALKEAKKLDIIIEIEPLKNFYKTIDKKLKEEIRKFNENLIERELRLKRFGSHFMLGTSLDELAKLIIECAAEDKILKVKGNFRTDLEKDKERLLNSLIERRLNEKDDLPKLSKEESRQVKVGFLKKIMNKFFPRPVKSVIDRFYQRFTAELKSDLKDGRIYLSKEISHEELKKFIFRDTYQAMFVSLQSRLNIKFRHIEIYLDKNVEIKRILELLNKLHHFEPLIDLDDLEKFITLKDSESILTSLIHASKADIPIDLKELWEYKLRGGNMSTMLEVYVMGYREGLKLKIPELTEQVSLRRNVEELVSGMIKLHQESIEMELDILGSFQSILITINQFVSDLIKASHLGLYFSYKGLLSYQANGGNIEEFMDIMIKAKQADLDISLDDCMKLLHAKSDIKLLFEALKTSKRVNLNISKEKLMDLQRAGGNMSQYTTACDLSVKLDLGIKPEELEADLIEGRNVLPIIFAIIYARNEGVKIDYHTSIKFDRIPGSDIPERIKWAVDPKIFYIEPVSIVTKDAIEARLKVNVTVRGKFMLYTQDKKDDMFTTRIKEGLVKEVERYSTYNTLIESLNVIAWRLFNRFLAKMSPSDFPEMDPEEIEKQNAIESRQNSISAYEILDINIPSLEIDTYTLSAIRKEEAEHEKLVWIEHAEKRKYTAKALELEAKAKLIESEAEINLGMAEALKKGTFNSKDYLKKKIFDDDKSNLTNKTPEDEH